MSARSEAMARALGGVKASHDRILHGSPSPAGHARLLRSFRVLQADEAGFFQTPPLPPSLQRVLAAKGGLSAIQSERKQTSPLTSRPTSARRARIHAAFLAENARKHAPPPWFSPSDSARSPSPNVRVSAELAARFERGDLSHLCSKNRIYLNASLTTAPGTLAYRRWRQGNASLHRGAPPRRSLSATSIAIAERIEREQPARHRILTGESSPPGKLRRNRIMALWHSHSFAPGHPLHL